MNLAAWAPRLALLGALVLSEARPATAAPVGIPSIAGDGRAAAEDTRRPFLVTTAGDDADADPGDGFCLTAGSVCSLRAAITEANLHPGPDTITFGIPGAGVHTIGLQAALPALSDETGPTLIDGYSQPGSAPNDHPLASNAAVQVEITGAGTSGFDGLRITSAGNEVRGLALYHLNRAVHLSGPGALGNRLTGNFIGTDAGGIHAAPRAVREGYGVMLDGGAAGNHIGGAGPAERNVIAGNAYHGVATYDSGTNQNRIMNNLIGLSPDGERRLPNGAHGIDINTGSSANVIGGTGPGERNVIAGNGLAGIEVSHGAETAGNVIRGNFIGTDVTGRRAPAWSAHSYYGILLEDGVSATVVEQNVIGNNAPGGIMILAAHGNSVTENWIGMSPDARPIPNALFGIHLRNGASGNQIGPGNVIASNGSGIQVADGATQGNTITRNSIFGNQALGIDLQPLEAVNGTDAGDDDRGGAGGQVNPPLLTGAGESLVEGTACGGCMVEVFLADGAPGSYGQGKAFLGAAPADVTGAFALAVRGISSGEVVTATATDSAGNTSEFARSLAVVEVKYAGGEGAITVADFKFSFGTGADGRAEGWLVHAPRAGGHLLSTLISSLEVHGGAASVWGFGQGTATGWAGPFNLVLSEHTYRLTVYDPGTGGALSTDEGALVGGAIRIVGPQ